MSVQCWTMSRAQGIAPMLDGTLVGKGQLILPIIPPVAHTKRNSDLRTIQFANFIPFTLFVHVCGDGSHSAPLHQEE